MGASDYFADGQWNFFCDLCGAKRKSGQGVRTWDNFYVCRHHKERRNPQDFVRGIKDDQTTPWNRVEGVDSFVNEAWARTLYSTVTQPSAAWTALQAIMLFSPNAALNSFALNGVGLGQNAPPGSSVAPAWIALGTGGDPQLSSVMTLESEIARRQCSGVAVASNLATFTVVFPAGTVVGNVQEVGLFNSPTGGVLIARLVLAMMSVGAGDTVSVTWLVTSM